MNSSPIPSTASTTQTNGIDIENKRILCTADIRGNISQLNQLARETRADYIVHTGDFGFYEQDSLERISDRTLKHLVQYSTLITPQERMQISKASPDDARRWINEAPQSRLSEFSDFLSGEKKLEVPVYTVWGACEDVAILERFRSQKYHIPNLHILDEATTHLLDVGGVALRLFGLGGAVVQHKLFDNGEGLDTIAGGCGTMWTTALQIGELVETAEQVFDASEIRVLVTHASPGREGLLAQLALVLRADFTISAGLHFRYGISYNEFACQPDQKHYRERLLQSQKGFMRLWDVIKDQVENSVDDHQTSLLQNALAVVNRLPSYQYDAADDGYEERDEQAFKNMWNFNLPDAAFGWVVLDANNGRVSAETRSQGFNFSYRRRPVEPSQAQPSQRVSPTLPSPTRSHSPAVYPPATEWPTSPYPDHHSQRPFNGHEWRDGEENQQGYTKRHSMQQRSPYVAYVGGLSNNTVTEEDIKNCFGRDKVVNVKFPLDVATRMPKAHCYVDFLDLTSLETALAMDGKFLKDNKMVINRPSQPADGRGRGRGQRGRGFRGGRANSDRS